MWESYFLGVKVAVILNLIYLTLKCHYDKAYYKSYQSWMILLPIIYSTVFIGICSWLGAIISAILIYTINDNGGKNNKCTTI